MRKVPLLAVGLAVSAVATVSSVFAAVNLEDPSARYAQRLFQRVVGAPIRVDTPLFERITRLVAEKKYEAAALAAMTDPRFYAVRVRNFSAPIGTLDGNPQDGFNDLQAMFIGVIRDDIDARQLLTGDFRYEGYSDLGLPVVSKSDNAHFAQFEARRLDYFRNLTRVPEQWKDIEEAAGVLTSRTWASVFFKAGTNRRAVQYTFQSFLCTPIDIWKDRGRPDLFVGRDVERTPGGNAATYQNHCRNCHGQMDGMRGAFGRFDFKDNAITWMGRTEIAAKMNQNSEKYPEGYVMVDDAWVNYATEHHNTVFGWRGPLEGHGVNAFGRMISESKGFSSCMARRVFSEVCNRPPTDPEQMMIQSLADRFEAGGYKFKSLFAAVAAENACVEHPIEGRSP